ncbi:pectinesterase-like [Solanum stenotomum]|uniref:pectinesterase-like n=1 Tax=Solanum stenotomum TaxID=172797 RepID=UPI0020D1AB0F|nr:pectinesterase-like [Solanum stenotomum]
MVVRSLDINKDPFRPQEKDEEILGDETPYLSAIGALMYRANNTRPDICFVVSLLAKFSSCPTRRHWKGAKHIFRYLQGTIDMDCCILMHPKCLNISHPPNVIVAKDGSENYNTIMAAVFASPNNSIAPYYIQIKQGIYEEYVQIDSWKTNIIFIGDGIDKTIITGNKSYGGGIGTYYTATVGKASADFCTFYRCQFDSFQDTVYAHRGKQFYRECTILGTNDFICGDAIAVFQDCLIEMRKPIKGQYIVITAQQRNDKTKPTGLVLQNCTLRLATPDAGDNVTMYLGRPWGNFSRTVIMNSYIDMLVNPRGWIEFEGMSRVQPYYLEYQNKGVGADIKRRVKWSSTTNDPRIVSNFTVRNFINGDKWIPSTVPHYLDLI